ncbi:unannotated protein [freshwater metagenome]|uniref:Unannotated protein n=1 Tax=freshwater metagenome TaxID=449393 RepID=A0A6J6DAB1_9ZZZZ
MRVRRQHQRRQRRRLGLLAKFAIISFVLLFVVGFGLVRFLNGVQRERRLEEATRSAQVIAQAGLQGQLAPADLRTGFRPLGPEQRNRLDQAFSTAIGEDGIVRLKIWNAEHWIVYSDNPRLVGRWFPGDDDLTAALRGEVSSTITDLSRPEEMEERDEDERLLAVYVPLRAFPDSTAFTDDETAEVIGAFEIYVAHAPIAAATAEDARNLTIALAASLLVLHLGLFRLVSRASKRLRIQADENAHQATHDLLTDLPNRGQLLSDLQRMLDRRGGSRYVALALLDVDHFKEINDALGHPSGDQVLRDIADRFREQMPDATVARIGGDEFAVAAENLPHPQAALAVATRIEQVLEAPFDVAGITVSVRPSIGIALGPDDGRTAEELLQHADVAMYVAKRTGSVRRLYSRNLDHYSQDRLELAGELRDAIAAASGEIMLAYQPKLDLATDEVRGVECLVRWKHPERGFVPPAEFLPIIENTELITPLTWLVLDQALATCAKWRQHGLEIQMAVNVSPRTFGSSELFDHVVESLERHQLPPSALELELTESALLGDHSLAAENVTRFRELGVSIAIDDFGTGYASVGYLTTLPLSSLKIDRSFVNRMFTDPAARAVVNFSVGLGQQLGLVVVAEGIEDEPTLEELRELGVNTGQGYFISRPMPAVEFLHWLLAWSTRHLTPRDVAPELDDDETTAAARALVGASSTTSAHALVGAGASDLPPPTFDLSPYAPEGAATGGNDGDDAPVGSTAWADPDGAGVEWAAFELPSDLADADVDITREIAVDTSDEPVDGDDADVLAGPAPLRLGIDPSQRAGVDLVIGTASDGGTLEWTPGPSVPAPIPMLKLPRPDDDADAVDGTDVPASSWVPTASGSLPPPLSLSFDTPAPSESPSEWPSQPVSEFDVDGATADDPRTEVPS